MHHAIPGSFLSGASAANSKLLAASIDIKGKALNNL